MMSPQRQAIIRAIQNGHNTPKLIGEFVGKHFRTVSKLLYLMEKDNEIEKIGYGKYKVADGYKESIHIPIQLEGDSIENRLQYPDVFKPLQSKGKDNTNPAIPAHTKNIVKLLT